MIRGKELDERTYNPEHIHEVLEEVRGNFSKYFSRRNKQEWSLTFAGAIIDYEKEQPSYQSYLDLEALDEFQDNPNAFKRETRSKCPIIRRCLMSMDEVMKDYKRSFNEISGRDLLNAVKKIAEFGQTYVDVFDSETHDNCKTVDELKLDELNKAEFGCTGVIGYGVQSTFLFGQFPHAFAHRSQNAVWSLYFLSGRKDFGIEDGSEFLMASPKYSTCEQNYFYPADLFGYYSLQLFKMLRDACKCKDIELKNKYRYIYLSAFCNLVAEVHRNDIEVLKWSSDYVESHWH